MKFLYLTNQKRLRFIGVEKYCLVKWCVRLCHCSSPFNIIVKCEFFFSFSFLWFIFVCVWNVSVLLFCFLFSLHVCSALLCSTLLCSACLFVYFSLVRNCQHASLNFRAKFETFRLFGIHFAIWYWCARTHAYAGTLPMKKKKFFFGNE